MDIQTTDMSCMELCEELKARIREFKSLQGPGMEKYKALLVREHARGIKKVGALRAELEAKRKARQGGSTAPGWQTWWKWGQGKLRQLREFLALKPRGKCGSGQLAHLPHSLARGDNQHTKEVASIEGTTSQPGRGIASPRISKDQLIP
ncbi:MAG: hypothetical protein ACOX5J_00300 [Candidatus Hydrogenedentales bacterium]|jgi:hypothetical protein